MKKTYLHFILAACLGAAMGEILYLCGLSFMQIVVVTLLQFAITVNCVLTRELE